MSIEIALVEVLYSENCGFPSYGDDIAVMPEIGFDKIRNLIKKMKLIQKKMRIARNVTLNKPTSDDDCWYLKPKD